MDWTLWLGDLYRIKGLTEHQVGLITIGVAGICGAIVGLEREKREKPAGLRTLILICVGSSIFTLASLLIAGDRLDRGRVAAQVVTGIGFLGAGAIIHERRSVVGLTTAATIWTVSAIGIIVGIGYAAAGVVLSFLTFMILVLLRALERRMFGPCRWVLARVEYRPERGKSRLRLQAMLDDHHIPATAYRFLGTGSPEAAPPVERMEVRYCARHRAHRTFISDIANLGDVLAIEERDGEPMKDKE